MPESVAEQVGAAAEVPAQGDVLSPAVDHPSRTSGTPGCRRGGSRRSTASDSDDEEAPRGRVGAIARRTPAATGPCPEFVHEDVPEPLPEPRATAGFPARRSLAPQRRSMKSSPLPFAASYEARRRRPDHEEAGRSVPSGTSASRFQNRSSASRTSDSFRPSGRGNFFLLADLRRSIEKAAVPSPASPAAAARSPRETPPGGARRRSASTNAAAAGSSSGARSRRRRRGNSPRRDRAPGRGSRGSLRGTRKSGAGPRSRSRWKSQSGGSPATPSTDREDGRGSAPIPEHSSPRNSPWRNFRNAASHASAAAVSGSTFEERVDPRLRREGAENRGAERVERVTERRPTPSTISSTRRRSVAKSG